MTLRARAWLFNLVILVIALLLAGLDDMRRRLRQAIAQQEQGRRKLEALSRAGSAFVASVSHELRRPLTGLLGHLSLQLPAAQPKAAKANDQGPDRDSTLAVLVVDDVAFNRDVIREFLQTAGHRVAEARDGRQAMERLGKGGPFDVVLMDINMPAMDGLEATRRIRAAGESWSDVPILGLTATAFDEQVRTCVEAGMNGCIAKPVVWDDLFGQLAAVTGTARERVARVAPKAAPAVPAARPAVEAPIFEPRQVDDFAAYPGEAQALRSHVEALEYLKAETAGLAGLLPDGGTIGQIARIAHAVRRAAADFGFTRIAILAGEIETAAQAGPGEQARMAALVAGLADSVEAAMAEAARPDAVSRAGV
ncbi:MAG: response regulator [Sneathiellaceae bacterium]